MTIGNQQLRESRAGCGQKGRVRRLVVFVSITPASIGHLRGELQIIGEAVTGRVCPGQRKNKRLGSLRVNLDFVLSKDLARVARSDVAGQSVR